MLIRVSKPLKVAIVDHNDMFSLALAAMISKIPYLKLAGLMKDGVNLFNSIFEMKPDVVMLGLEPPFQQSVSITRSLKSQHPDIKVVAVSDVNEGHLVQEMLNAGAHSFISKEFDRKPFEELLEALTHNRRYICPKAAINYTLHVHQSGIISPAADHPFTKGELKSNIRLTDREREIVRYIADGLSDKEIADRLGISTRTVGSHKQNIFEKTGTRKSTELVNLAYTQKWI